MNSARTYLEHDWYAGGIPANVVVGENVYIDTSYGFAPFFSQCNPGLILGKACGAYDRTTFVVGTKGRIVVEAYTCLNGTYLVCNDSITIGEHCLLAWGVVLTDTWIEPNAPVAVRRAVLHAAATDPARRLPPFATPRPITLNDNVWVGFDAVILPGATLGRGCVVGCKTVVAEDVPPYAVVVGNPARIIRFLEPDDTDAVRDRALQEYSRD
jgi:acetyltransferase-like isoleucine patch superfamily enzyme